MGINKGKLKRARKELEKSFTQGRYWDFLKNVEAEALGDSFTRESDQAWRALVREAFDSSGKMLRFFAMVKELKTIPHKPDIRFLITVERFLNGENVAAEMETVKNLSPLSLVMQKRLLRWDDSLSDTKRTEELFALFLKNPGKVTKKHYIEVSDFFSGTYDFALDSLPFSFESVRKFNLKGSINKKRRGIDLGALAEIDNELKVVGKLCPENIFLTIMAPYLYQVSLLYQNYCWNDTGFAADLCRAMPFLTRQLTGARWQEVENLLLESNLQATYENDSSLVRTRIATAGFPEKVKLLNDLGSTLDRLDGGVDDPVFDNKNLAAGEARIFKDYLLLYKDVLAEIGKTKITLSQRDQKELEQVMSGILEKDFEKFYHDPDACPKFLKAIAQAGCLDTKLALTALIISRHAGDKDMREPAEKALPTLPVPVTKDIEWVFKHFAFLCYPTVSNLYPVIRYFKDNKQLIDSVSSLLIRHVTRTLCENYMKIHMKHFPFRFLMDGFSQKHARDEMSQFREELTNFKELQRDARLLDLVECYPEGYITEAGLKKMIIRKYNRSGIGMIIDTLLAIPFPEMNALGLNTGISKDAGFDRLIALRADAAMDCIKQHADDLRDTSLDRIKSLVEYLEKNAASPEEMPFFLKLNNVLQDRENSGEKEAGPLIRKIINIIREAGKKRKRSGKRR